MTKVVDTSAALPKVTDTGTTLPRVDHDVVARALGAQQVRVGDELGPQAAALVKAALKAKCRATLEAQAERVQHFKHRASELGKRSDDVVIVLLNVDDPIGGDLAEQLMPGENWQQYRDRGETPFARGLAGKDGILGVLYMLDSGVAAKLRAMQDLAVVVMDYGTVEVFPA